MEFTDNSSGAATNYYWDFGDETYSTDQNPTHTFEKGGYYNVTLYTLDTVSNCASSFFNFVKVEGVVDCHAKYSSLTSGLSVNFADASLGGANEWFWNFGDGHSSSEQNPQYTYEKSGYYHVTLAIRNSGAGCKDVYHNFVKVGTSDCKTSFTFFSDPATKEVTLVDNSYGDPNIFMWDLGDGKYSKDSSLVHQYESDGIYTVCLNTYNSQNGCANSLCQDVKVGNGGVDCEAKFESFTDDKTVSFSDKSLGDGDTWFYDFGDGDYSTSKDASHTYTKAGYYDVCLTTINTVNGCSNTNCVNITVGSTAPANDCIAKYSFTTNQDTKEVVFKDASYGEPVTYNWQFDSAGTETSADANPTHTFAAPGFYPVYLTITTTSGCTKTFSDVVSIGREGLYGNFIYEKDSSMFFKNQVTYPVSFYGSAYGKPSKWKWAFGDNTYDSLRVNPTHYYTNAGAYNACMTISDPVAKLSNVKCSQVKVGGVVTGIRNSSQDLGLSIYPNPMDDAGVIAYTLTQNADVQIKIFDMQGRVVKSYFNGVQGAGSHVHAIETSEFKASAGLYIVNLVINGKSYNRPISIKK